MVHFYYKVEISTVLDEDQQILARTALLQLGKQSNTNPCNITHLRSSVDGQIITVEMETPVNLTKAEACTKLSELLPWTAQQISNNTTFTKQTREQAGQDIMDNKVEWGEEE